MTNLHYIADEQLGGVEREYAEVERKADVGDYVVITEAWEHYSRYDNGDILFVNKSTSRGISSDAVATEYCEGNPSGFISDKEYSTLDPTGNVRIDGTVYRMVDRNAAVGEKVLALEYSDDSVRIGSIHVVEAAEFGDGSVRTNEYSAFFDTSIGDKYAVLEPVERIDELTLTESDVRNNPRQVIDLIANMAGRLSKLESKVALTDDRVSRLGTANQQAYETVSRNVETWAQEFEEYKQSPAPWATQEQLVELTKQVAEIAGRKQQKDTAVEISELTAKSALLIAEAKVILERMALTAEERREL